MDSAKWIVDNELMGKDGPLQEKSYDYAKLVVLMCKEIQERKKEFIMTKQLIRSGTSVGAMIEEAQHAESRNDFISKLSIALKEAYESRFWIRLLHDTEYLSSEKEQLLLRKVNEVIPMLIASIKTAKRNKP